MAIDKIRFRDASYVQPNDGTGEWARFENVAGTLTYDSTPGSAYTKKVAAGDVAVKVDRVAFLGTGSSSGVFASWQNPESGRILVTRVIVDLTTAAGAAATVDVGVTATSATTASDTLLDGIDVNAATGVFDSMNPALDSGANAKAQAVASGKWITMAEASGNVSAAAGYIYIFYVVV